MRHLSAALLPYMGTVMGGEGTWQKDPTVHRAIEIRDGFILKPKILTFQKRASKYPYPVLDN